ncbi:30S ribosomal protein S20 [bacterium]|nr:30S ribosomal protein S20 [bacterium]
MPNTKSAKKELRKSSRKKLVNSALKQTFKKNLKTIRKDIEKGENVENTDALKNTVKIIDKAAKKGVIKKNTASRYKSRLQKKINKTSKK